MLVSLTSTLLGLTVVRISEWCLCNEKASAGSAIAISCHPAPGNNHGICFEAMEIRKCLQEMRYDRLNSSTVARPKYGAVKYKTIARIYVKH